MSGLQMNPWQVPQEFKDLKATNDNINDGYVSAYTTSVLLSLSHLKKTSQWLFGVVRALY